MAYFNNATSLSSSKCRLGDVGNHLLDSSVSSGIEEIDLSQNKRYTSRVNFYLSTDNKNNNNNDNTNVHNESIDEINVANFNEQSTSGNKNFKKYLLISLKITMTYKAREYAIS